MKFVWQSWHFSAFHFSESMAVFEAIFLKIFQHSRTVLLGKIYLLRAIFNSLATRYTRVHKVADDKTDHIYTDNTSKTNHLIKFFKFNDFHVESSSCPP